MWEGELTRRREGEYFDIVRNDGKDDDGEEEEGSTINEYHLYAPLATNNKKYACLASPQKEEIYKY